MRKHRKSHRLISFLLIGSLCVSLYGCGTTDPENISDYGTIPEESQTTEVSPVEKIEETERKTTARSLHEIYGDPINFQTDFLAELHRYSAVTYSKNSHSFHYFRLLTSIPAPSRALRIFCTSSMAFSLSP